jgi:lantibiotic transport system ATP-binding protein
MALAIETVDLCRRFGDAAPWSTASTCRCPSGSVYGFLGRNGAGKTTTLKLLLGLLRADAGQVFIDGIDIARDRIAAARRIGALLEAHGFYGHLSGQENLDLARRLLGLPPVRSIACWRSPASLRRRVAAWPTTRWACASAWAWRARCSARRRCCCSTNP